MTPLKARSCSLTKWSLFAIDGARGTRTPDPLGAIQTGSSQGFVVIYWAFPDFRPAAVPE